MDQVDVPKLPEHASVDEAWAAMRNANRSAVVFGESSEMRMATAGSLAHFRQQGKRLSEIPDLPPLDAPTNPGTPDIFKSLSYQMKRPSAPSSGITVSTVNLNLHVVTLNVASVAMSAILLAGPRDCYCKNTPEHGWDVQDVEDFKQDTQGRHLCKTCGKVVDCS